MEDEMNFCGATHEWHCWFVVRKTEKDGKIETGGSDIGSFHDIATCKYFFFSEAQMAQRLLRLKLLAPNVGLWSSLYGF